MDINNRSREPISSSQHALISWKAIFAGLLVALLVDLTLMSLGAAVGGSSISKIIEENGNGNSLVTGIGLWMAITLFLSLAVGSYFAARMSTFITGRVGAAQGHRIRQTMFGLYLRRHNVVQ